MTLSRPFCAISSLSSPFRPGKISCNRTASRVDAVPKFDKSRDQAKDAREKLLAAVADTDRGVSSSAQQKAEILNLAQNLAELGRGQVTTGSDLSGTWKLAWTTEKEILFIIKNASWFGTKAGEIYQVIDIAENSLQNAIYFPPDGAFVVTSSIEIESQQRTAFEFNNARLELPENKRIPLPPFGKGWFDSVYMDDLIRVANDIRGDVSVSLRDGGPRVL